MKNPKAKGNRREREILKLLEKNGFYCCKSGGSLGDWDLVAIPHLKTDLLPAVIQVKSNRISRKEMVKLGNANIKAEKYIYIKKDYVKKWIIWKWDTENCKWDRR